MARASLEHRLQSCRNLNLIGIMSLSISRSALVMYSSQQMFDLINNVSDYPEFLPWCAGATVLEQDDLQMVASLDVKKGGVRQRFTTRNRFDGNERISMALLDGPFQRLSGGWQFISLSADACKVVLELEFELKKGITKLTFGPVFNQAANSMVDAFCERARAVYG